MKAKEILFPSLGQSFQNGFLAKAATVIISAEDEMQESQGENGSANLSSTGLPPHSQNPRLSAKEHKSHSSLHHHIEEQGDRSEGH